MSEKRRASYKQPPKHSQFKRGQSGNPAGRPKGSRNVRTVLIEALGARLKIKENGANKTLTKLEIFLQRTVNDAIQGNDSGADRLVKLLSRYAPPEADGDLAPDVTAEDEALLERFGDLVQRKLRGHRTRRGNEEDDG